MSRGAWTILLLATCVLVIGVESAVIRKWRHKAKMNATAPTPSQLLPAKPKSRKGFRATHSRCCKIGEKVAKRKLYCDIQVLEVVRKFNDMQRTKLKYNRPRKIVNSTISAKLSNKLRKCSASFPKYFEKCCKYREQFYQSMAKCRKRQGKERRKCRQSVRKRYKSPRSAPRKKQKNSNRKTRVEQ